MEPARSVRMSRFVPFAAGLLACCALAPAASIQYVAQFHADDVGFGADPDVHRDSSSFGQVAASIPSVASSTSTLVGSASGFTFTADQSRTDTGFARVHTLLSISFIPSSDVPVTFAGEYAVHRRGSSPAATNVAVYLALSDVTAGDVLIDYELNDQMSSDTTLSIPAPSTPMLLANHTYILFFEAFNDTYPGLDGGTTAEARISLFAVPLPSAAGMGLAALSLVALRRPR